MAEPASGSEIPLSEAELRARSAWDDWTEEDIEDELRAWKELSAIEGPAGGSPSS